MAANLLIQPDPKLQRRRDFADSLAMQSRSTAPVGSKWEALARVLTGGIAGLEGHAVDKAETERTTAAQKALAEALSGGGGMSDMASKLSGVSGLEPLATQLALQGASNKYKTEQQLAAEQRDREFRKELADIEYNRNKELYGMRSSDKMAEEERQFERQKKLKEMELNAKNNAPNFRDKERIKVDEKQRAELSASAPSRQQSIEKAARFLKLFEDGGMSSGSGRKFMLDWVPGVYTEQGQLDEEFNAFAEVAARQALKASGEVRPTDDDVKGMKEAMFGVGRDEQVNVNLLSDYLDQQLQTENDYRALNGLPPITKEQLFSGGQDKQEVKNEDPNTKTLNGKTYVKRDGAWYEQ